MVESVSRELILPAIRLDVPPRPSEQQVAALAENSADAWAVTPRDLVTQQVVRLAVAAVLAARLAQAGPGRGERQPLPSDPEQVTLGQLAGLFRPHVDLAAQAFTLAVVETVNAGVPAAADPMREGLRRVGVTGRDRMKMVALGLEKVPARARSEFWEAVKTSTTLTAVVDAVAAGDSSRPHDVTGLDRSQLARADALVLAGGRVTPVAFGARAEQPGGRSWLQVPLTVSRRTRRPAPDERGRPDGRADGRGGERVVDVGLRAEAWTEVFETALDAVTSAMLEIDLGSRPRSARTTGLADAIAGRLVAAKRRTVADVLASLRDIGPFALEMFDHQVTTASVPVAVPVVEDDRFVQLWLPTSALAGPLVTGSADLFLGGGTDYRTLGGARPAEGGRAGARPGGRPGGRGPRPEGERAGGDKPAGDRPPREGGRPARRGKKRPSEPRPAGEGPVTEPTTPPAPGSEAPATEPSAPPVEPTAPVGPATVGVPSSTEPAGSVPSSTEPVSHPTPAETGGASEGDPS